MLSDYIVMLCSDAIHVGVSNIGSDFEQDSLL